MIDAKTVSTRIGWLLCAERKKKRWNQTLAAKKVGMSQSSYSRFENGEVDITLFDFSKICDSLGVDAPKALKMVLA